MKFEKVFPSPLLKPYIKHLVISEASEEQTYKVFPSTGLVMGFQYRGRLAYITKDGENPLSNTGITGLQDGFRVFKSNPNIGSVLVFFNEIGASYFLKTPINELYAESVSLEHFINRYDLEKVEEALSTAETDEYRIYIIEQFLLARIIEKKDDKLVIKAIQYIYHSKGKIKIKALAEILCISQSPFEKRFRQLVGTSPKKFASIVRFHAVLDSLNQVKSMTEICFENNYFDQAHFIKDFKHFTGETPEKFIKKNDK
ncbi:helix-turn-helix domain-containing protein [Arcicella aquatica]|uniref:Helix-turn-helix domain-containing protein n=1 Tax=Arcicella aquatica TaxID=217141 RepID=A0ABU5QI59_9BACT|nr:helix-turn-helix domain-containing protein [Arcicella aquatica]MEA5256529.1 helix-turn-helix domain-containing protein [Arcicella aquatica]